jgi:HEAT repeat protein
MNGAEENIAALIARLEDPQKATIRAAVDELIDLSSVMPGLRGSLEQLLNEAQRKNRWAIAYVLCHLPEPCRVAILALLGGLDHRESDIRWAIALLLVRLAGTDSDLIQDLVALCRSGSVNQRRMAAYCIRDLQLSDNVSMAALLAAARDADPTVRVAALTSLKRRRDAGASERSLLLDRFMNDADSRVRNAAAVTLAQLGLPEETFIRTLEQNIRNGDPHARRAARAALNLLQIKRPAPYGS